MITIKKRKKGSDARSKIIAANVTQAVHDKICAIAEANNKTRSEVVSDILAQWSEQNVKL